LLKKGEIRLGGVVGGGGGGVGRVGGIGVGRRKDNDVELY